MSKKSPKVFLTREIDPASLLPLRGWCDLEVWPHENPPPHNILLEKAGECDGLLTLLTDPIDAVVIQAGAKNLKVISQMAVGVDNIDLVAASAAGIPIGHTPGVLTDTCADFTWALIMAASRRIAEADREVRQNIWRPWGPDVLCGTDLNGATLGIIGFGRIGQAVARRAAGFNMRILYHDPQTHPELEDALHAHYAPLDQLLKEADIVTLHVYLSPATHGMIGYEQLCLMKPTAILVNTARGFVVKSGDLVQALTEKRLAGAALDVFDPEPIPAGHPILQFPNVVLTPHIASASRQTRKKMADIAVQNLVAGLKGARLPYCANPVVYL